MTRCVPQLYDSRGDVLSAWAIKQFLRVGGLGVASVATIAGTYQALSSQCDENILTKCIITVGVGLAVRAYSSTIQVFRTSDNKRASLKDIGELLQSNN